MTNAKLAGLRVLLVEDQMIVAMLVEELLRDFGCVVVGPVGRLAQALRLAQEEAIDLAILDVNLDGKAIWPVADALRARGVPVILSTGYSRAALPEAQRALPLLEKPIESAGLLALLHAVAGTAMAPS